MSHRSSARQLHSTENYNRALRRALERDVIISEPHSEYTSAEIGTRATVVPHRPFTFKVKHRLIDTDYAPEFRDDPDNILGPVLEGAIPVVTSSDPMSLLAAFNKRCNFIQSGRADDIADHEFKMALQLVRDLPDLYRDDQYRENDVDRARWLAKFDQPKRERMEAAWAARPDSTLKDIRDKTLMVKVESLLKRDDDGWAPRAVYVGSDAHNAITGPAMMVAMERWVNILDTDREGSKLGPVDVRFAYKKDDVYLMEHLTRDASCTNAVEGDFSRNDREQRSRVALIIDAVLEKLNFTEGFRNLMIQSSEEYCVYGTAAGLKAWLKHQLPTGTTATTFRNSVFNPVMFAVALIQQRITHARAVILGDDILAVMRALMRLDLWVNTVDRFKMVLKASAPNLDGGATFLSRRVIVSTSRPCLIPKIGKALARFNVRACKNAAISDDAYMAGKSLAHAYEFRHAPAFVTMFLTRFEHHWARMTEQERLDDGLQYDSWFVKISGLKTVGQIKHASLTAPVKLTRLELFDWLAETYEEMPTDILSFSNKVITGTAYEVLDSGIIDALSIDF